ncbi:hypothetical protein ACG04Q_19530 [Roseateles sp. DXS20W]|uniref:Uncharacterized protein n=1 Tax=Pelomonas lactea TaxID=3299030 RepID=A0ABW7GPA6_9BURK
MFVRHSRALVWRDEAPTTSAASAAPRRRHLPPVQVIWARKPWRCAAGICIAVRLRGGELEVALRDTPSPRWVPAARALSPREADRWAAEGF